MFENLVVYFGYLLLISNICLFSLKISKLKTVYKIFYAYLLLTFIIQLSTEILFLNGKNNLFLSHFYLVGQFVLLSLCYKMLFIRKRLKQWVFWTTLLVLIILFIQYILSPELFKVFNLTEVLITALVLTTYAILFLFRSLDSSTEFIYINIGTLIYILCSALIFASGNLMTELDPMVNKVVWVVNGVLYIIFQIFIFIEWRKNC